jgi:hypothetical protein
MYIMNSSRSEYGRTVYGMEWRVPVMSIMRDDCERYKNQWTLSRYQRRVSPSPGLTATYSDNISMIFPPYHNSRLDLGGYDVGGQPNFPCGMLGPCDFIPPLGLPDYSDGIVGLALGGKM